MWMKKNRRAVGLISAGLDSVVSAAIVKEEGYDIIGVHILTPFVSGLGSKTLTTLKYISESLEFDLRILKSDEEYIELVKNPKYGYGKNINPCIDCHIYMLSKAKKIMEEEGADFVFTGEVVGQRKKSQTKEALRIIERDLGLEGKLLRPLSAQLLPETQMEINGLIDRNKLLSIEGKQRVLQLEIAKEKGLKFFQTPAGGCLLTEERFCNRLKDLFKYKPNSYNEDYVLLQLGRHFRVSEDTKLIVARDADENKKMINHLGCDKFTVYSSILPEVKAVIDGMPNELALKIFASYISAQEIEVVVEKDSSQIMKKVVRGENKLNYHKYLL